MCPHLATSSDHLAASSSCSHGYLIWRAASGSVLPYFPDSTRSSKSLWKSTSGSHLLGSQGLEPLRFYSNASGSDHLQFWRRCRWVRGRKGKLHTLPPARFLRIRHCQSSVVLSPCAWGRRLSLPIGRRTGESELLKVGRQAENDSIADLTKGRSHLQWLQSWRLNVSRCFPRHPQLKLFQQ